MKPLIILNWKMNLLFEDMISITKQLSQPDLVSNNWIIAPPAPYLAYAAKQYPNLLYAGQNLSIYPDSGAYTGEYSAQMLKSCDVKYVIIGHSERRQLMQEDNEQIKQKLVNSINAGLIPILCIGDSLNAKKEDRVLEYLDLQLNVLTELKCQQIVIAYEPVWAIGSNQTPSSEELMPILDFIKRHKVLESVASEVKLVYGGSVNADNIHHFLQLSQLDGVMVGSAALNIEKIKLLVKNIHV